MFVEAKLSIGFPSAVVIDEVEIFESDMEGMNEEEREKHVSEVLREWANDHIEISWEKKED